jgi:uncharacterized protein YceK
MRYVTVIRSLCLLIVVLMAGCFAGCGSRKADPKQYIPAERAARLALEKALSQWREGGLPGPIGSGGCNAIDSQWQDGQGLSSFQITKQEVADETRWFTVRLTLRDAPEEETRYAVVGKVPALWVCREADYPKNFGSMGD